MKRLTVLSWAVILMVGFAWAAIPDRHIQNIPKEGGNYHPLAKGGKGLVGFTAIGPMGYADAWRTIASMPGKSICVSNDGMNIAVLYSQYSGNTSTPSNVKFAFSTDAGATWTHYDIVSNRNARTYSGMALGADLTPFVVWQDRIGGKPWPILLSYDEMGFGGGLFSDPIHLTDSAAFYLPSLAVRGNKLITAAFPHSAFGYDQTIYMALGDISNLSSGITWTSPWDLSGPWGWKDWLDSPNDDQDSPDFMISEDGQTIMALTDELYPESQNLGGNGYAPCITWSTDGGVTWQNDGVNNIKYYLYTGYLPPDGMGGGWWYRFDGLWYGGKPHLAFITEDLEYNGSYIVYSTPVNAGDYNTWRHVVINAPEPTHRYGLGLSADWPTLSVDAAGRLYCTYVTWTASNIKDIWCVVSEDMGNTWHKPFRLTDATQNPSWVEAAEVAGDNKIHFITVNYAQMDTLYYGTINTADPLSMPMHQPLNEALLPIQFGRPASDPVIDTIDSDNNPGDTLDFVWTWNTLTFHGNYHIQISQDEAFTAPYTWTGGNIETNYFTRGANPYAPLNIGLPWNGLVYWRVRFETEAKDNGPWSEVYRFDYEGATLNTTDWMPDGVSGHPTHNTFRFALNQNRPNPVNNNTQISFSLPRAQDYSLRIYNVAGQTVQEFRGQGQAGVNSINWNASRVPNGIYFYKLTSGGQSSTKRLVVVK